MATGRPDRGIYLNSNRETQPTAVSDVTGRYIVDNVILKILMKYDNSTPRRARWIEVLVIYFFEIEHRPGKKMGHADYLSRIN